MNILIIMSFRGGGGGRGGGRGRGRMGGYGMGPSGLCQCPKCGKKVSHRPGIPCNQIICPECGIPMMRRGINQISPRTVQNWGQNLAVNQISPRTVQNWGQNPAVNQISPRSIQNWGQQERFPIVDKNKCNGCGECVNQCPNGAISLKDDKAVINLIKCQNCRICEDICPVNAIH